MSQVTNPTNSRLINNSGNTEKKSLSSSKRPEDYYVKRERETGDSSSSSRKTKSNYISQVKTFRLHTPQQIRQGSSSSLFRGNETPIQSGDSSLYTTRDIRSFRADQYVQLSPSKAITNYVVNPAIKPLSQQNKRTQSMKIGEDTLNNDISVNEKTHLSNNLSLPSFLSPSVTQNIKSGNSTERSTAQAQPKQQMQTQSQDRLSKITAPPFVSSADISFGKNMNSSNNFYCSQSVLEDDEQSGPVSSLKNTLEMLIQREEEVINGIVVRANKLADIFNLLGGPEQFGFSNESDFTKFRESVQELMHTLSQAAKTETQLGASNREIEQLTIENRKISKKHKTVQDRNQQLQKVIDLQQQRIKRLLEENSKLLIRLNSEKKENRVREKKVTALEKRVEFILENDVNVVLNPNDKLRQSLNELLRENESLKRDLTHKNQEIERATGNIKRMGDIIGRLNSKIDMFRKNPEGIPKQFSSLSETKEPITKDNITNSNNEFLLSTTGRLKKNDDIDLFSNFVIPPNLDFRIVSLKSDHQNVISDLIEGGSINFTKQTMSSNSQLHQKDVLNLVSTQFLSFKELSEKLNLMLSEIHCLFNDKEWKDVIPNLNFTIAKLFNAKSARVWIVDCQLGLLVTWENGRERRCLVSKGMISDCFFSGKSINSKNSRNKPLMYIVNNEREESVVVDTCLLMPIIETYTKQVKMVVEVSNSMNELFSFDEEYLSIILVHYFSSLISYKYTMKLQQHAIKFNSQMIEEFDCLMYSKSKFEFANKLKQAYSRCFGISNCLFYFVEGENLIKYEANGNQQVFSVQHGLVGQAVQDMKPYIITNIKQSQYYNKLVDLNTILPLFAIPLIDTENQGQSDENNVPVNICLGVIEITIKQKFRSEKVDMLIDGFTGYFGLEESLSIKVQQFSKIVAHAIRTLKAHQLLGFK